MITCPAAVQIDTSSTSITAFIKSSIYNLIVLYRICYLFAVDGNGTQRYLQILKCISGKVFGVSCLTDLNCQETNGV